MFYPCHKSKTSNEDNDDDGDDDDNDDDGGDDDDDGATSRRGEGLTTPSPPPPCCQVFLKSIMKTKLYMIQERTHHLTNSSLTLLCDNIFKTNTPPSSKLSHL